MMQQIKTEKAPAAIGPYSQAVKHNGLVFVSGQIPVVPETGEIPSDIVGQTRQALENLGNVLEAAGSSLSKTLRVTVFIKDMSQFSEINKIYNEYFTEPYPSRSCVEASNLPKNVGIEIDAIGFTD